MVDYLPRSAWGARPAEGGPGSLTISLVEGVAIHWPGTSSTKPIHSQAAVAAALRGWQDYHMDVRGWSDIAYQVAIDQAGRAWTLRGLRTQSGANGNNDVNERYGAILLILISGEEPSEAMKATTRAVVADFRRIYPKGLAIKPHSLVRPASTDCPGDEARAAIARGDFTPRATPPKGTPVALTTTEIQAIADAVWAKMLGPSTANDCAQKSRTAAEKWADDGTLTTKLNTAGSDIQMVSANLNELRTVVDQIKTKVDTL